MYLNQIWNTTKFVAYKGLKLLLADLKRVYAVSSYWQNWISLMKNEAGNILLITKS